MVVVEELSKLYGPRTALGGLNFKVGQGEVLGLLGPNGAGKSTTLRILTSLCRQSGGTVKIKGYDTVRDSIKTRSLIGYLPDNNPLYAEMSVRAFLNFVARAKGAANATRVSGECGLDEVLNRPIAKLSKGYRQRVGLAQALIGDPELLILDEPTVGLDPRQILGIRTLIKSLAGQRTVIISSHILPEINQLCDRVLILNNGQLVADAAPAELRRAGAQVLRLRLATAPGRAVEVLRALPGVCRVACSSADVLEIEAEPGCDPRPAVAAAAAEFGLLELSLQESSLEQVFMQLVSTEASADA